MVGAELLGRRASLRAPGVSSMVGLISQLYSALQRDDLSVRDVSVMFSPASFSYDIRLVDSEGLSRSFRLPASSVVLRASSGERFTAQDALLGLVDIDPSAARFEVEPQTLVLITQMARAAHCAAV